MKIYSWNINGLRAVLKKPEFSVFLEKEQPDILLLQEIKISKEARYQEKLDFSQWGYQVFWNSAQRPGYSGTLSLVKSKEVKALQVVNGIGKEKFDKEGRVQTLELPNFYLLNIYFPNANHELSRLPYKLEFNFALAEYVEKLNKLNPVILVGDFNVAHEEKDLARPKDNVGKAGFTQEERNWLHTFLGRGFVDIYRYFYPEKIQYTWWTYRAMARERNIGWRIDYFVVAQALIQKIKTTQIHDEIMGSDHCPISLEISWRF